MGGGGSMQQGFVSLARSFLQSVLRSDDTEWLKAASAMCCTCEKREAFYTKRNEQITLATHGIRRQSFLDGLSR